MCDKNEIWCSAIICILMRTPPNIINQTVCWSFVINYARKRTSGLDTHPVRGTGSPSIYGLGGLATNNSTRITRCSGTRLPFTFSPCIFRLKERKWRQHSPLGDELRPDGEDRRGPVAALDEGRGLRGVLHGASPAQLDFHLLSFMICNLRVIAICCTINADEFFRLTVFPPLKESLLHRFIQNFINQAYKFWTVGYKNKSESYWRALKSLKLRYLNFLFSGLGLEEIGDSL